MHGIIRRSLTGRRIVPTPLSDSLPSGPVLTPPANAFRLPHLRWLICGVLFFGSVVNYIDRGTISILSHHVQKIFSMSQSDYGWIIFSFQLSYAIMMLAFGWIIDRLGTRTGFALAMAWWSLAAMGQALARGVASFAVACGLLGMGEAGNFPGSIKAVAEWFPKRERALATGIFNSGTAVGAVISYPLVGWLFLRWGWQMAFVGTGALGLICVAVWLLFYRLPGQHPWITPGELQHIETEHGDDQDVRGARLAWGKIFGYRQAWSFLLAKFMTDPVWWFYIFWLPKYLIEARHFSIENLRLFGFIPFLAAVPGSVAGGWLSGYLLRRGRSVNFARKTALLACALCMPLGILAVFSASPWMALGLHLNRNRLPPGLVRQCLYPRLRYVSEEGRGLGGGNRGSRGRFRRSDPGVGGRPYSATPLVSPAVYHCRNHASPGHGGCPTADPENRENSHCSKGIIASQTLRGVFLMPKDSEINRRDFIKTTARTGAGLAALGGISFFTKPERIFGANDRVRVAVVGLHGQGWAHVEEYSKMPDVEIAAVCDVDENVMNGRAGRDGKDGDQETRHLHRPAQASGRQVDRRHLHRHAQPLALAASHLGLPGRQGCLRAKSPCATTRGRASQLVRAVEKYNRIVQHGTNSRSGQAIIEGVQKMRDGLIGDVYLSRGLCYKWRNTIGHAPEEPVPAGVHYDLWTGPAPLKPFTKNRFHYNWHWVWDTGNGDFGNQGIHELDVARWGLGVKYPEPHRGHRRPRDV